MSQEPMKRSPNGDQQQRQTQGAESAYENPVPSCSWKEDLQEVVSSVDEDDPEPPRKTRKIAYTVGVKARNRCRERLLRKLRDLVDEFANRVGQQIAVIIVKDEGKKKCVSFGSQPLVAIVEKYGNVVVEDLKVARSAEASSNKDPKLFPLPSLLMDGIAVEKMTQARLRCLLPVLIKQSTGRKKCVWGDDTKKPEWWPSDLPYKNIRIDPREEAVKKRVAWTEILRKAVLNCYKFHNREDLLPVDGSWFEGLSTPPPVAPLRKPPAETPRNSVSTTIEVVVNDPGEPIACEPIDCGPISLDVPSLTDPTFQPDPQHETPRYIFFDRNLGGYVLLLPENLKVQQATGGATFYNNNGGFEFDVEPVSVLSGIFEEQKAEILGCFADDK